MTATRTRTEIERIGDHLPLASMDEGDWHTFTIEGTFGPMQAADLFGGRVRVLVDDGEVIVHRFTADRAKLLESTATFTHVAPEVIANYITQVW